MKSKHHFRSIRDTLPIVASHPETKASFFRRLSELSPRFETWLVQGKSGVLATDNMLGLILSCMHQISQHREIVYPLTREDQIAELRPEHYGYINKAIIHTLHDILGTHFTDQVKEAWGTALNEVAVALMESQQVEEGSDRLKE